RPGQTAAVTRVPAANTATETPIWTRSFQRAERLRRSSARPSSARTAAPTPNVATRTGSRTNADLRKPSSKNAPAARARKNAQTIAIPPRRGTFRLCSLRELSAVSTICRRNANSRTAAVNPSEIASDRKNVMENYPRRTVISLTDWRRQRGATTKSKEPRVLAIGQESGPVTLRATRRETLDRAARIAGSAFARNRPEHRDRRFAAAVHTAQRAREVARDVVERRILDGPHGIAAVGPGDLDEAADVDERIPGPQPGGLRHAGHGDMRGRRSRGARGHGTPGCAARPGGHVRGTHRRRDRGDAFQHFRDMLRPLQAVGNLGNGGAQLRRGVHLDGPRTEHSDMADGVRRERADDDQDER